MSKKNFLNLFFGSGRKILKLFIFFPLFLKLLIQSLNFFSFFNIFWRQIFIFLLELVQVLLQIW
jgi:hypothetical protein